MKTSIGLDYGTQSARAVLVDVETGDILATAAYPYPHGVMPGSLASTEDCETALYTLLEKMCIPKYKDTIAAVCVDTTSLTMVAVDSQGRSLAAVPGFEDREQAQIKLWKRHAAQQQADEALALAREMNEPFLQRTGGALSSEWGLPKILEIRDKDPEVYAKMDLAMDLCEYLTYKMTGKPMRSQATMCYKMLWSPDLGFPSDAFLNALRPGFAQEYKDLLRGDVLCPGQAAGEMRLELAEQLGLTQKVIVATGTIDGYMPAASLGALNDGDAALAIGTSNVLALQTDKLRAVPGICGIGADVMSPGLYGIECGQNCTGDMLEWLIRNSLPPEIMDAAQTQKKSPHQIMTERIDRPWECKVTVLDWWNGSRNAPCDLSLRGTMAGLSLETRPEDIYLAMLQSIACGTREILEQCAAYGVKVHRMLITGGISLKNPLLMNQYANILHMPVLAGDVPEGPALGAAMFGAVAAGLYDSVQDAAEHMSAKKFIRYDPDEAHADAYEAIYRRNHTLRQAVRGWNHGAK